MPQHGRPSGWIDAPHYAECCGVEETPRAAVTGSARPTLPCAVCAETVLQLRWQFTTSAGPSIQKTLSVYLPAWQRCTILDVRIAEEMKICLPQNTLI